MPPNVGVHKGPRLSKVFCDKVFLFYGVLAFSGLSRESDRRPGTHRAGIPEGLTIDATDALSVLRLARLRYGVRRWRQGAMDSGFGGKGAGGRAGRDGHQ